LIFPVWCGQKARRQQLQEGWGQAWPTQKDGMGRLD
jgi:hypothetical protein